MPLTGGTLIELEWLQGTTRGRLAVLSPLILATDLIFLLGGEVILDVERLSDLLRRLALDHIGDCLASNIEERLDVKVVGGLVYVSVERKRTRCCRM